MTLITPDSNIRLLKLPIELDMNNQLDFASATAQYNYFSSLPYIEEDNATYQRQDGTIRFPACRDDIIEYNYCMYQNHAYGNKWFYCFITGMDYLNSEVTAVRIKTDTFQTWQFDINILNTFVEREHVNDDTLGKNTIPEGLETGDYIIKSLEYDDYFNDTCICVGSTIDLTQSITSTTDTKISDTYNGIPAGLGYFRYDTNSGLLSILGTLANAGKSSAIVTMFMAPTALCPNTLYQNAKINGSADPVTSWIYVDAVTSIDGYTPVNKKVLCYPYCFYEVTNNVGGANILKPELWQNRTGHSDKELLTIGSLAPSCSIRAFPKNYAGIEFNLDEGISAGKYPQIAWPVDLYTNWEVQNGSNVFGVQSATEYATVKGAAGITTGAIGLMSSVVGLGNIGDSINNLANGFGATFDAMTQQYQHQMIPNSVSGNINSGDVTTSYGRNRIECLTKTIKKEYAIIIDKYFSAYGYKVNQIKIPNTTGRLNWNYVKTIGCNIHAYAPIEDINEIKRMFDNGLTIWHNPTTFLDYSQTNSIL